MKFIAPYLFAILGIALGAFFIYHGVDKHFLSPCKTYGPESTLPQHYINVMAALCETGFTKVIGFIEVSAGLLLVFPRTRLLGTMMILPVIFSIFLLHLLIDNRFHELVETGIPLIIAISIFSFRHKEWKPILFRRQISKHDSPLRRAIFYAINLIDSICYY